MTSDALEQAGALGFDDYDPGVVVAAVNALLPLDKDGALERLELHGSRTGIFWVLRVAFEMPADTGHPPVRLGAPQPPPPDDGRALPRFPIVLALDVPLLPVSGYELGGLGETPMDHIGQYRQHGRLRTRRLEPSTDETEVEAEFSRQWTAAYASPVPDVTDRVRTQIVRAREVRAG